MLFTDNEYKYLSDQDFLLTKRLIVDKMVGLFSGLEAELKDVVHACNFNFPTGTKLRSGKISKGENFRGLPYVILDYPRLFSNRAIFAYRTMFWWGNFFTNTLHISGDALACVPYIRPVSSELLLYVQSEGDPWDHSLNSAKEVNKIQPSSLLAKYSPFIKISQKMPLEHYTSLNDYSKSFFKQLFDIP